MAADLPCRTCFCFCTAASAHTHTHTHTHTYTRTHTHVFYLPVFRCGQGGFTELISTAEKAWTAISKRSPPDVTAIDRVKAAVSLRLVLTGRRGERTEAFLVERGRERF